MNAWRNIDAFLAAHGIRIGPPTPGQTTGGTHKPNSFHYQGLARDYGRSDSDMAKILAALRPYATGPDRIVEELFGLALYIDGGRIIAPSKGLYATHQDHVHVALRPGRTLPVPTDDQENTVADNPDLLNIEGPLELHLLVDAQGDCRGYAIFSTKTGELHGYGPGWTYYGRSEDPTPG